MFPSQWVTMKYIVCYISNDYNQTVPVMPISSYFSGKAGQVHRVMLDTGQARSVTLDSSRDCILPAVGEPRSDQAAYSALIEAEIGLAL